MEFSAERLRGSTRVWCSLTMVIVVEESHRFEEKRRHAAALQDASAKRAGEFEFGHGSGF